MLTFEAHSQNNFSAKQHCPLNWTSFPQLCPEQHAQGCSPRGRRFWNESWCFVDQWMLKWCLLVLTLVQNKGQLWNCFMHRFLGKKLPPTHLGFRKVSSVWSCVGVCMCAWHMREGASETLLTQMNAPVRLCSHKKKVPARLCLHEERWQWDSKICWGHTTSVASSLTVSLNCLTSWSWTRTNVGLFARFSPRPMSWSWGGLKWFSEFAQGIGHMTKAMVGFECQKWWSQPTQMQLQLTQLLVLSLSVVWPLNTVVQHTMHVSSCSATLADLSFLNDCVSVVSGHLKGAQMIWLCCIAICVCFVSCWFHICLPNVTAFSLFPGFGANSWLGMKLVHLTSIAKDGDTFLNSSSSPSKSTGWWASLPVTIFSFHLVKLIPTLVFVCPASCTSFLLLILWQMTNELSCDTSTKPNPQNPFPFFLLFLVHMCNAALQFGA